MRGRTHGAGWLALPPPGTPPGLRSWLEERGSLTLRLKAHCHHFQVQVLDQGWALPHGDERRLLGLRPGQRARVREVLLCCDGRPAVFAHSVLVSRRPSPLCRSFQGLGGRSLGTSLLFVDARVSHGPLSFRALSPRHPLGQALVRATGQRLQPPCYARRALHRKGGTGVLVTEVFLPELPA